MLIQPRAECRPFTPQEYDKFLLISIQLMVASTQAQEYRWDPRTHPVTLASLRPYGLGPAIPLWLLYQGLVEHLLPLWPTLADTPSYQPVASVVLQDTSAFVLTKAGEAFYDAFLGKMLFPPEQGGNPHEALSWLVFGKLLPRYEKDDRIFAWGAHLLKWFQQPAPNQELLLRTAEELGWRSWLDAPLPQRPCRNPKRRLHDTIADLNRRQQPFLIRFKGDGTGTRFGWMFRRPAPTELQQRSHSHDLDNRKCRDSLGAGVSQAAEEQPEREESAKAGPQRVSQPPEKDPRVRALAAEALRLLLRPVVDARMQPSQR